jgi:hypothetical protein
MTSPPLAAETETLRRQLRRWRLTAAALLAVLAALGYSSVARWARENPERTGRVSVATDAPQSKAVKKILRPLRYSGLPALLRPEVRLEVDFSSRTWTLRNMHKFDANGQALLDDGRYGACGQLAVHAYQKIQTLFDQSYRVRIVAAAESGFFPPPRSTHFVLRITDVSNPMAPKDFILDPAFRRYGPTETFDDYVLYREVGFLQFIQSRGRDETHTVNGGTPLFIRNQAMLGFAVRETDGKLDTGNYTVALSVTRRHKYYSRPLLLLRKVDGKTEVLEDRGLLEDVLTAEEYETIKKRLYQLFEAAARPA